MWGRGIREATCGRRQLTGRGMLLLTVMVVCGTAWLLGASDALASANVHWGAGIHATLPGGADTSAPWIAGQIDAVSCASASSCIGVGTYRDMNHAYQAFTVAEKSGVWGKGVEVMLPTNLAAGDNAALYSVSCAAAGDCTAVGSAYDGAGNEQGLVVTEHAGVWGPGHEVALPGDAASNPEVILVSLSCPSAGNCSAVGTYTDTSSATHGLLLREVQGQWQSTDSVGLNDTIRPPAGATTGDPSSDLLSVSCGSAGNCAAVGDYRDDSGNREGLVISEVGGDWQTPGAEADLPPQAKTSLQDAELNSVSCPVVGECAAVGYYIDNSGDQQALLLNQHNGLWVPGTKAVLPLNAVKGNALANPLAVSCASPGNCAAVGNYSNGASSYGGLLLNESGGHWSDGAQAVLPGGAASTQSTYLYSVSCPMTGDCAAVGTYQDRSTNKQAFVVTQASGRWQHGVRVALPADAYRSPNVFVQALYGGPNVSCGAVGSCAAGGTYVIDSQYDEEALLVSASPVRPRLSVTAPATARTGHLIAASSVTGTLRAGSAPIGTISFRVFGPQSAAPSSCRSGGKLVGSAKVSGNRGYHPSAGFKAAKAGDYWWYALYGGDMSDTAATSQCSAKMPKTVVK